MKKLTDLSASVHQKLLNRARSDVRPFNELLQYYAIERFLSRLSSSSYRENFILKGALALWGWQAPNSRPTRDIDLLGITDNEINSVTGIVADICKTEIEPDGLVFDISDISGTRITEDAEYEGVRVKFQCFLGKARIPMQIDIGFGDIVIPHPEKINISGLLDNKEFELQCYSKESFIAEKFQAIIKFGQMNSRMKDFYDIWLLSRQYDFSGEKLSNAIRETFIKRNTSIPEKIKAFDPEFIIARDRQWKVFVNRFVNVKIPEDFSEVTGQISNMNWPAPGPWRYL
jgi:predicted nucleotidyltransferase component of viral defense system